MLILTELPARFDSCLARNCTEPVGCERRLAGGKRFVTEASTAEESVSAPIESE